MGGGGGEAIERGGGFERERERVGPCRRGDGLIAEEIHPSYKADDRRLEIKLLVFSFFRPKPILIIRTHGVV